MELTALCALIPAYKPDERLLRLIEALKEKGFGLVLVVDDGGGEDFRPLFDRARELGAVVLGHPVNRGKGAALKTGFAYLLQNGVRPVVTCDCDGQHSPEDCARVGEALLKNPEALVLGVRDKSQMPLRSKCGNRLSCFLLGVTTGLWITDTQTGLRGIPAGRIEAFSQIEGERYDYEMNMLLCARRARIRALEITIRTIYFGENEGTHFRAIQDGLKIYGLLFKQIGAYIGSSAAAGLIDILVFSLLHKWMPEGDSLFLSWQGPVRNVLSTIFPAEFAFPAIAARLVSSLFNYFVNRELVFKSHAGKRSLLYYYMLVVAVLFFDIQLINLLTGLGLPAIPAKIIADGVMFLASYNVQQKLVFTSRGKS